MPINKYGRIVQNRIPQSYVKTFNKYGRQISGPVNSRNGPRLPGTGPPRVIYSNTPQRQNVTQKPKPTQSASNYLFQPLKNAYGKPFKNAYSRIKNKTSNAFKKIDKKLLYYTNPVKYHKYYGNKPQFNKYPAFLTKQLIKNDPMWGVKKPNNPINSTYISLFRTFPQNYKNRKNRVMKVSNRNWNYYKQKDPKLIAYAINSNSNLNGINFAYYNKTGKVNQKLKKRVLNARNSFLPVNLRRHTKDIHKIVNIMTRVQPSNNKNRIKMYF